MRQLGSLALVLALAACGGGGGTSHAVTAALPAVPSTGGAATNRTCKSTAISSQEAYIAYNDHIDVYPSTASGDDCPVRTISAIAPPNVWGIAIGNNTIYALERSAANAAFSPVLMIDAASNGPAVPSGSTIVRNDGSGGIVYVDAIPAVFETGHNASYPVIESFPPSPALANGSVQQNRFFTGGGASLAVAPDGTVYAGVGAGVDVYAPTAVDSGPQGSPGFTPAPPERVIGDTSNANVPEGIALAPDGTLYVASAPASDPTQSTIAVYAPSASTPSYSIATPTVASIAVDASGELLVLHLHLLDTYAPGGTTPIRSLIVSPPTGGPSSLALGP